MKPRAGVVALVAAMFAAGAASLVRPGYSPDEEFTLFAVRGIGAHGLPLLPSGLLYDRGLLYSYLAWLASALTGLELPAFRALSLASAAGALVLGHALVRRIASPPAAALAVVLVATSSPFWAVATTGRFYAPFLLTCVGVLTVVARLGGPGVLKGTERAENRTTRTHAWRRAWAGPWLALGLLAFLSRLTHELAFTLMAVPALGLVMSQGQSLWQLSQGLSPMRPTRRDWLRAGAAMGAGLAAAQALLMALHFVMPRGEGSTMIERFFLWQVLNLFERPQGAPLGVVLAATVVAWLLVPARAAASLLTGSFGALVVMAFALARATGSTPPSGTLVQHVAASGLAYPLDMFWHLAGAHPVMLWLALVLLVARLTGLGGEWPAGERAAHLAWVGWVLWFGVIDSGITINYVLLPTVGLLAAIGIDLVAVGQRVVTAWPGARGQVTRAALVGAALLVVLDQWPGPGPLPQRLARVRPTIDVPGIEAVRATLRPDDRVACTDELACLLLVGRVDAWLALDDYVRERFVVPRGPDAVGVYAGSPAVFRLSDLFEPGASGAPPARVVVVDVFKEYAVGNSAAWLPRALAAERVRFHTRLLTRQARVVEVAPGELSD